METQEHAPRRGLALVALLTLTVGLGAAAILLSVRQAIESGALPYRDPGRLVRLQGVLKSKGRSTPFPLSQMDFADWRLQSTVFSEASVFGSLAFNLEQGERSEHLWGELINPGYFPLLGLQPAAGRFFAPAEDARPFERYVVVLGYDLWRHTFAADPRVVGRVLRLNGGSYRVVGVGPQGFRGLSDKADLWVPSMLPPIRDYLTVRRERWIAAGVARLKPGITIGQAQEQMDRITAALAQRFPNMNEGQGVTLAPLAEAWVGKLRPALPRLTLGVGLLVFFACFGASWLLALSAAGPLARGAIALAAAALALGLAQWGTPALLSASGIGLPSFVRFSVTPAVTAVILVLALLSGLALSQTSALRWRRPGGWRWFQNAVVLLNVALALFLLVATAMAFASFRRTVGENLGFRPNGLLTFRIDLKGQAYMDNSVVSELLRQRYLPGIAAVPGVRQVAISNPTMPTDSLSGGYITIDDHASEAPDGTYIVMWHSVGPGYFETLGIPIVAGRGFNENDVSSNAVIVSKALARQQWPGKNPLGRHLKQDARKIATEPWMDVVGVVGDVRHEGIRLERAPAPDIYMSVLQFPLRLPLTINFLVRPQPGASIARLRTDLQREIKILNPELPQYDMATLEERLATQKGKLRFPVLLTGLFAGLALVLAAVGLYCVRVRPERLEATAPPLPVPGENVTAPFPSPREFS